MADLPLTGRPLRANDLWDLFETMLKTRYQTTQSLLPQCPMCSGATEVPGELCLKCQGQAAQDSAKIDQLMAAGHSYHCAARQTWGDGPGCEGCPGAPIFSGG